MSYKIGKIGGFKPVGSTAGRGIPEDRWTMEVLEKRLERMAEEIRLLKESSFKLREEDFPVLPGPSSSLGSAPVVPAPSILHTVDGQVFSFNPFIPPPTATLPRSTLLPTPRILPRRTLLPTPGTSPLDTSVVAPHASRSLVGASAPGRPSGPVFRALGPARLPFVPGRRPLSNHGPARQPPRPHRVYQNNPTNPRTPLQPLSTTLFRYLQLSHHLRNWTSLPSSLNGKLESFLPPFVNDINPPLANDSLRRNFTARITTFKEGIAADVSTHLMKEITGIEGQLKRMGKGDNLEEAVATAKTLLQQRLQKKFNAPAVDKDLSYVKILLNSSSVSIVDIVNDNSLVASSVAVPIVNVDSSVASSVATSNLATITTGCIVPNINLTPAKTDLILLNKFDVLRDLGDEFVPKSIRKRLRSLNNSSSDELEIIIPATSPPIPKSQRKLRKRNTPEILFPPMSNDIESPLEPLVTCPPSITTPKPHETDLIPSNPESLTPTLNPKEAEISPNPPTSPVFSPGHNAPFLDNNIFSASQTFSDNLFCSMPVNLSQPLPPYRKQNVRRALLSDKTVPELKIKISIIAADVNSNLNIGAKTTVENKLNIDLTLTDNTKILIIGDSNLRQMDANLFNPDWHIICIPGANLELVCMLLKELPVSLKLTDIIITAGVCDSKQSEAPILKCLNVLDRFKVRKHFLGLSWNLNVLSRQQSKNLTHINNIAELDNTTNYIKPPLNINFATDGIHLDPNSVKLITDKIWFHMERFLCPVPQRRWKFN